MKFGAKNDLFYAALAESKILWQWSTIGSILLNIILLFWVIGFVTPKLNKVEPIFIQFSTSEDVYFKQLPMRNLTGKQEMDVITHFLRQYVDYAETFDHEDLVYFRVPTIIEMSSPEIEQFQKEKYQKSKTNLADFIRRVHIISDSSIEHVEENKGGYGIHQIEFRTTTRKKNTNFYEKQNWIATIKYTYAVREVNKTQAQINPLGIQIYDYQISERMIDNEAEETPIIPATNPFEQESEDVK